MKLKCKPLSPKLGREVPYPYYASSGAAAMDLHACLDDAVTIQPGQRVMIPTGLAIALPDAGYVALIFARSGLGVKHGIVPANCVGVIDSDYRGEVKVALQNHGDQPLRRPHRSDGGHAGAPAGAGMDGGAAGHPARSRWVWLHGDVNCLPIPP